MTTYSSHGPSVPPVSADELRLISIVRDLGLTTVEATKRLLVEPPLPKGAAKPKSMY